MFEKVYGGRTDGRTPDRPVYYKLTLSGELKMNKPYLLTFGKVIKETAIQTTCVRKLSDWNRGLPRSMLAHTASLQLKWSKFNLRHAFKGDSVKHKMEQSPRPAIFLC